MGNQNSGRRPTPTALVVLRGNPSRKRLNRDEPKPPTGPVLKPANLSAPAGVVWDRVAPVWIAQGTLTPSDVEAFATLCELQSSLDAARATKNAAEYAAIEADGRPSAAVRLELKLAPIIRAYYGLFGGDPSSRTKISAPKKADEPTSKWAGVLK